MNGTYHSLKFYCSYGNRKRGRCRRFQLALAWILGAVAHSTALSDSLQDHSRVDLGVRPGYLVESMRPGPLKSQLLQCGDKPQQVSRFSIGHRGAPLGFPEHTRESYVAAARQGAGILECDVNVTSDGEMVCRHGDCDLHRTTNILLDEDLVGKCREPFRPAETDASGSLVHAATASCCTSDLTLDEFKRLRGRRDVVNPRAQDPQSYLDAGNPWSSSQYPVATTGELLSHRESVELFLRLDRAMAPELKRSPSTVAGNGETQSRLAQQLVDEYRQAQVAPEQVWLQSFNLDDVEYWIANAPEIRDQVVLLDWRYTRADFDPMDPSGWTPTMEELADRGVRNLAPPIWFLVTTGTDKDVVPTVYAERAKAAGLNLIAWTLERSGELADGDGGAYYSSLGPVLRDRRSEGVVLEVLDVLARDIGVRGVFSDWPATVTYYANCLGLE